MKGVKRMNGNAGKGDTYRPVNWKLYEENYERIFGHKSADPHHATPQQTAEQAGQQDAAASGVQAAPAAEQAISPAGQDVQRR
jgi:hypothetical protein